jgi:holo-ACP synthase
MGNIPGNKKNFPYSRELVEWGMMHVQMFASRARIQFKDVRRIRGELGYVVLLAADEDPVLLKQLCLEAEREHPLSPYWDLDVFDGNGEKIARSQLEKPPRRCFLCEAPAKRCAFLQLHPPSILQLKIKQDILAYGRMTPFPRATLSGGGNSEWEKIEDMSM